MQVYDNGKLIKTFPISTGRDQYPTMDGVHIALEKSPVVTMDSATVGIPKGNPGYYNETVYWDVRISNGGEFVHAAPWSVGSPGLHQRLARLREPQHRRTPSGSTTGRRLGDIVDVYNGVRPPETGDAGTADWNMSWKQWLAGDAAPTKAAKALHPRRPHLRAELQPVQAHVAATSRHSRARRGAHRSTAAKKHVRPSTAPARRHVSLSATQLSPPAAAPVDPRSCGSTGTSSISSSSYTTATLAR